MESMHEPVAVLGIGAMGHGMATSALRAGIRTIVWNRNPAATRDLAALGAAGTTSNPSLSPRPPPPSLPPSPSPPPPPPPLPLARALFMVSQAGGAVEDRRQWQLSTEEHAALLKADAEICDLLRFHAIRFQSRCDT